MTARPIIFDWTGTAMVPRRPFMKDADARFVIGEGYMLEAVELRSAASHRHYFATVNDAWASLPDELLARFPSPVHMRKWALIKAGFCTMKQDVFPSKAEAARVCAFVKKHIDDFAIATVKGPVVTVYRADLLERKAA